MFYFEPCYPPVLSLSVAILTNFGCLLFFQFDFVYVTGDLPPHDEVERTRESVLFVTTTIASMMREYLPDKRVFFTLGNHESAPVNT